MTLQASRLLRSPWPYAALILAALPAFAGASSTLVTVLTYAFLFAAAAQAWNIIGGFAGQISFANGAFFGLAAYTSALVTTQLHVSVYLGIICGILVAVGASIVLGLLTFTLGGVYFSLATFVTSLMFGIFANHANGLLGGSNGFNLPLLESGWQTLQFATPVPFYEMGLVVGVLYALLTAIIAAGKLGLVLRAIRADEVVAAASGHAVQRYKLLAFALSAAMAALPGALYVQYTLLIDPESAFGVTNALLPALITVIGGPGTVSGPVVGSILVPISQYLTLSHIGPRGTGPVLYGVAIIAIAKLLPGGLVSLARRTRPQTLRKATAPTRVVP